MQQQICKQQAAQRKQAQRYSELDFNCLFDSSSFDEEVETDERWLGLVRDENGMLQVYAEFVFDGAVDEDGERMGMGWYL
jgi:hypothetical protein